MKKMCWLCGDTAAVLYNGAPGVDGGFFDGACLACAAEKVTDFDDGDIVAIGEMTDARKRAFVLAAGLVAAG